MMAAVYNVRESWKTPATKYPLRAVGTAEIVREKQKAGYYFMEGVGGYILYYCRKPIDVTALEINGETVMVDDPLHWVGMKELARNCKGRVLIGGLGLGLILHALQDNEDVLEITVYEMNPDVIELVNPLLPNDSRARIVQGDVLAHLAGLAGKTCQAPTGNGTPVLDTMYDTIVLDIWWGSRGTPKAMPGDIFSTIIRVQMAFPDAKLFVWGHRDQRLNPAVKMPYEKLRELVKIYEGG